MKGAPWRPADDALLMERIAEGDTFPQVARRMDRTKPAVEHRFYKLAARFGWQAA